VNAESASYLRPSELQSALAALAVAPRLVLAGGTDLYASGTPVPAKLRQRVLDITAIDQLRAIRAEPGEIIVGATATWTQLNRADLPPWFSGLKQAARQIGALQIQNVATIAGNLCNASPAADGIPPLLALSALIELSCVGGSRTVPLDEFVLGARRVACANDELVTAVRIPRRSPRARSVFYKLGARSYLVISIVSLAVTLDFDTQGCICYARIAAGSCAARGQRLLTLEGRLLGLGRAAARALPIVDESVFEVAPIDDIRATAAYRREVLLTLIERALREVCSG
jgi:CO/xanthine dehydrogenase FAD-binding subunit